MGIWSWLFPTDEDRLRRARVHIAAGRYEDARSLLFRCQAPEAEALYDQCCAAVDKQDNAAIKKRLAGDGFHGWRVQVSLSNGRRKTELEKLIAEEIARAGIDLGLPEVDEKALKAAIARAQRRAKVTSGPSETGAIKLVPAAPAQLAGRER